MKIRLTKHLSGTTYKVGYFLDMPDFGPLQSNAPNLRIETDAESTSLSKPSQIGALDTTSSLSAQSSDHDALCLPGANSLEDTRELINLSEHMGGHFSVRLREVLSCYECGQNFKKLYRGFCYPCLVSAPSADICWMNPEHCHHAMGTCRSEDWANARCFTGHSVYLAYTSDFKIGITSTSRLSQRWIEQGASSAVKLCQTNSRRTAGLIEKYFKQFLKDRTNNKSLANQMISKAENQSAQILTLAQSLKQSHEAKLAKWLSDQAPAIRYRWSPLKAYFFDHPALVDFEHAANMPSLKLWRQPRESAHQGRLLAIQGRVLSFDQGYLSVSGYELELVRIN